MVYPPPLRRRRRRRLLWLAGLGTLLVAGAIAVVQLRGERAEVTDYLAVAHEVATTFEGISIDVESIVTDLGSRERQIVLDALEQALGSAGAARTRLEEAPVPPRVGALNGFLTVSVTAWESGVRTLSSTLVAMMDDPGLVEGIATLEAAFLDMRLGDAAYGRFRGELEALGDTVTRTYPDVRFIADGKELAYQPEIFANRIEELRGLSARHDLAVADVSFLPTPVGDLEGVPAVPFAETFEVRVTVANRGNETEVGFDVVARIFRQDGTEEAAEERQRVELLEPGQALTLSFLELPVVPGAVYELVVLAELPEDADPASNEERRVFYRNEPS